MALCMCMTPSNLHFPRFNIFNGEFSFAIVRIQLNRLHVYLVST